jgi:capsular polysaccharide biosynthesis protein
MSMGHKHTLKRALQMANSYLGSVKANDVADETDQELVEILAELGILINTSDNLFGELLTIAKQKDKEKAGKINNLLGE